MDDSLFNSLGGNLLLTGLVVVAAYFIGNLSPAILISKAKGGDIRQTGSGNAGTTNVLRAYGKKAAAATLLIDVLKGAGAVLLGSAVGGPLAAYLCADAVVLGHIWPVLYGFRGGKGIATALGVLLSTSLPVGLIAAAVAFTVIALTRRVSMGSMSAAALVPFLIYYFVPGFLPYGLVLVAAVVWKHRGNIRRILKGEEPKIKL